MSDGYLHTDLLTRLLADAERHAQARREREALVLLRWASRIAPRERMPAVLLTYHRLRAARARQHAEQPGDGSPRSGSAGGLPRLRFPTRAPDVDRSAFVPAPAPRQTMATPGSVHRGRVAQPRRSLLIAALSAAGIPLLLAFQESRGAHPLRPRPPGEEPVFSIAGQSAALLRRGRALLATGDTARAIAVLADAAQIPSATSGDIAEAARLIEDVPGTADASADAYLRAFAKGLSREHWPDAIAALERAGRHSEAGRLRNLLDGASW